MIHEFLFLQYVIASIAWQSHRIGLCFVYIRLLIAAGAYYFFLDEKVTKNQDSKNASFAAHGLCPAKRAEPRLRLFAPLSHPLVPRFCKTLMPSLAQATMFCPLSPGSSFAVGEAKYYCCSFAMTHIMAKLFYTSAHLHIHASAH
ncbi:MAG: hypothetical protein V4592_00670 [Bacteroidota bacterium]